MITYVPEVILLPLPNKEMEKITGHSNPRYITLISH